MYYVYMLLEILSFPLPLPIPSLSLIYYVLCMYFMYFYFVYIEVKKGLQTVLLSKPWLIIPFKILLNNQVDDWQETSHNYLICHLTWKRKQFAFNIFYPIVTIKCSSTFKFLSFTFLKVFETHFLNNSMYGFLTGLYLECHLKAFSI